jgi:PAS domain S-box-containing protein
MKQKFHYIIGLAALVVFMFISVIAFYIHKDTESKINNQFAKTELIMAKFVTHEVKSSIGRLISELDSISKNPDAIKMDILNIPFFVKNNMNEVMHTGIIHNIIFVSDRGKIVYNYPTDRNIYKVSSEYDLSVLKKYSDEIESGKAILSDMYELLDKRGKAASLFVPILSAENKYKGAIGVLIDFNKMRSGYLEPIESLRSYSMTIINEEGVNVETVCKDFSGFHHYEGCKNTGCLSDSENECIVELYEKVSMETEGVTSFIVDDVLPSNKPISLKKFAAFSTFSVANRTFSLILSVPYETITFLVQKNFQYILIILGTTLIFILSLSYLLFEINKKRIKAEEVERHLISETDLKSELTFSEEKYKKVMDEALEGIAIFKGVEIIEVNKAWADMYETTEKKSIGMSIYDIAHYDSINMIKDYFMGMDVAGEEALVHYYDINVTTRKGKKRVHNVSISRLDIPDNMICVVARDVTEKRLEERRIQESKEQLERANKELDFYISSIVHDIKNPLVAAKGFMNILINEYCTIYDNKKDIYISKVSSNISHIFDLLNSLLELSKIGRMEKQIERIDLKREIGMIKGYLSSYFDEKKAVLNIATPLPIIYTDRTLITQIYENLISNAIKFSRDGVPPVIEIGSKDKGKFIEFYVKDNGIGVEKKNNKLILRVFGRVNEDMQGSGVGLNVVKKSVEELGGVLSFESEYNAGSTFYFTIPKKEKFFYLRDLKAIS